MIVSPCPCMLVVVLRHSSYHQSKIIDTSPRTGQWSRGAILPLASRSLVPGGSFAFLVHGASHDPHTPAHARGERRHRRLQVVRELQLAPARPRGCRSAAAGVCAGVSGRVLGSTQGSHSEGNPTLTLRQNAHHGVLYFVFSAVVGIRRTSRDVRPLSLSCVDADGRAFRLQA